MAIIINGKQWNGESVDSDQSIQESQNQTQTESPSGVSSVSISKEEIEKSRPVGVGPVSSSEDYGAMLKIPVDKELDKPIGVGDVLTSAAETVYPYTNEKLAKLYSTTHPRLTENQWYNVINKRQEKYRSEYPVGSVVTNIGGATGAAIGAGALLGAAGVTAPVSAGLGLGYAALTGPGIPEKRMTDPGYAKEAFAETALSVLGPMAVRTVGKYVGGKGYSYVMQKLSKDPETKRAWSEFRSNPKMFEGVTDVKKARDDIINEMNNAVDSINDQISTGKIEKADAGKAFTSLSQEYRSIVSDLSARARELREPPEHTARMVEDFIDSLKLKRASLYDDAFKMAPDTVTWASDPEKYGLKYVDFISSMNEALSRKLGKIRGPERRQAVIEANELASYHTGEMAQDLGIDEGTSRFLKDNRDVILDRSLINNSLSEKAAGYNTDLSRIRQAASLVANMDPQIVRNYTSSMHKRGSGFKTLQEMANPSSKLMSGDIEREIVKDWRDSWMAKIAKSPGMEGFKSEYEKAYAFNNDFVIPIEKRMSVVGASQNSTARQFSSMMKDTEPQMMNSLKAASKYGVAESDNLIELGSRLKNAVMASRSIGTMPFKKAIKIISERDSLADEAIDQLNMITDPVFKSNFKELARVALEAKNQKDILHTITKEAEEFVKKYGAAKGASRSKIETWMGQQSTGRKSMSNLNDVRTDAQNGLESIQMFMNNGNEQAVNKAMSEIRNLRSLEQLNARQMNGSRQAVQSAALGAVAGSLFGIPSGLAAVGGILGNTIADKFTAGKWSNLSPWIIEKMLNTSVANHKAFFGKNLMEGAVMREMGGGNFIYNYLPGSPEAYEAVRIVISDPKLSPLEKSEAIKKINKDGIQGEVENGQ